jgi:hypothetical protein
VTTETIESKIRWAGLVIVAGLALETFTLFFVHPIAFMAFLLIACPLIAVGILLFLHGLVSGSAA